MKKTYKPEALLFELGIQHYTKRHVDAITDFVESGNTDCTRLLDQLGAWDQNDLIITEGWFNGIEREETVTISKKEYDDLLDDSLKLSALEGVGVDNWCGWDDAMEAYNEMKEAK